ncbi:MAG: DUF547 domain-containing protein, partial [Halobacteria archaeon]|nr:DUF547 domain-containing protein [Halobacteria archaeon]
YNAYVQILLTKNPSLHDNRRRFFGADEIYVAGEEISLDKIEHGMLRRSQFKWGLGYVPKPFPFVDPFEKLLRTDECDYRIHFALNCGAKSCPPIAVYTPDGIDDELDLATDVYLSQEVDYDSQEGVAYVPRLFLWYRGDFGGKRGVLNVLREHDIIPDGIKPKLRYKKYNWDLELGNYLESSFS